jgi:PAS domain S-box-containing protein
VLREGDLLQMGGSLSLRVVMHGTSTDTDAFRRAAKVSGVGTFRFQSQSGVFHLDAHAGRTFVAPGVTGWDCVVPSQRAALRDALTDAIGTGQCDVQVQLVGPGDTAPWVALRGEVFDDGAAMLAGVAFDITAQKQVEAQLRRQAQMFASLSDAVIVVTAEGNIAEWTGAATAIFGHAREAALGQHLATLLKPGDAGLLERLAPTAAPLPQSREERLVGALGPRLVEVTPVRFATEGEAAPLTVLLCRDVGERRAFEQARLRNERLSALGTLAAGLAHEVNNPLTYALGNLFVLKDELDKLSGDGKNAVLEAIGGLERVAALVRDMKQLSQQGEGEADARRPVDAQASVAFALRVADAQLKRRANVELELGGPALVLAQEARLGQVFLNLLINAAQALDETGPRERIVVRTRTEGDKWIFEVQDSGGGIPPEHQAQIFDPFFTTRAGRGGTGLGLSICHQTVVGLGGSLTFTSRPGETIFRVELPCAGEPTAPAVPVVRRGLKVLAVDDEELIPRMLKRSLKGHEVTGVHSAREALALLGDGCPFDLILCDVTMPVMGGLALLGQLQRDRPEAARRLVFMTGGALSEEQRDALARSEVTVLGKPFDLSQLDEVLKRFAREPLRG